MSGRSSTSEKQTIVILEGADMTGKTQIGQALAQELGVTYWKCDREWTAFKGDPAYFRNTVRYGDEYFLSYLRASGASVVKDRGYPSEWVYARVMGRDRDDGAVWHADAMYASLGAVIVLCRRSSYMGVSDDLFPGELGPERLAQIDSLYGEFARLSQCRIIMLNVDDQDLCRELSEIRAALAV